ncbi:MAG TPA: ATP/GTP-binding protein [Flavihumibacter sp.]|nr:ATP/GTP-binding protein [Bacteroidota bacterium]HOA37118.1 ATP/GTP-binding protein [Flavihumibacter sp.]HQD08046.1 ATP/GTP-binding protein [Flavihumibacter sp.]
MKRIIFLTVVMVLAGYRLHAQEKTVVELWKTDSVLKTPESVLLDPYTKTIYISNIDGEPWGKDGKGSIGKIGADGKNLVVDWVKGLQAPKGMGLYKDKLYVADVDEIVVIDVKAAKIAQRIPVAGSVNLNDVTVSPTGDVYVSDSKTGEIHLLRNGVLSKYLSGLNGINGVLSTADGFYFVAKGALYKANAGEHIKLAEGMEPSTDGVVQTKSGDFIVSSWVGVVYYIKKDGSKTELLNTMERKLTSADIDFDPVNNILYVPTFFSNTVVAYQVK